MACRAERAVRRFRELHLHDAPFRHAPKGALIVLFPWFDRRGTWSWKADGGGARKRLRRVYYNWEWEKRFEGYQARAAISEYMRRWTERWWGFDCQIVYPRS